MIILIIDEKKIVRIFFSSISSCFSTIFWKLGEATHQPEVGQAK